MFLMKEHVGKLISDVEELIYREKKPVESYRYKKAGAEKLAIDREDIPSWDTLKNEDIWGGNREYWPCACIRATLSRRLGRNPLRPPLP